VTGGDSSALEEGVYCTGLASCCERVFSRLYESLEISLERKECIPLAAQLVVYPGHRRHFEGQGLC